MDTSTVVVGIEKAGRRKVRRRVYTLEEKRRLVAEACAAGASVAEVGRRHGINANLLFNWCRQHQQGVLEEHTRQVKLLPVQVTGPELAIGEPRQVARIADEGRIEIVLAADIRVSIIGRVAGERIEQVLALLRRSA
jgi:transposase